MNFLRWRNCEQHGEVRGGWSLERKPKGRNGLPRSTFVGRENRLGCDGIGQPVTQVCPNKNTSVCGPFLGCSPGTLEILNFLSVL